MAFLTKIRGFHWGSLMLALMLSASAFAYENEISLTAAVRGEVGSLRFSSYNQDRGPVKQGDRLEFRFPFSEEKGAAVRILGIHQECGCLSQSLKAGQDLAQGTSSELVVKVDTTHFLGDFDKEVVILTNEDRDRPHVFRMKAKIERLITVSPPVVQLDERAVKIRVKTASKQTLHIEKVVYNEDTLEVQAYPVQEAWELVVRWKGESAPANMNETIELLMDGPVRNVKIPVVGARGKTSRLSLSAPR
ncbi:MAG TPA: DUF1573 domain-containing protein [Oligoflexus sp.]|uniref:DUF1573 domain-containing protein n=1 Tax=Oligoflexus sp. TaxID=1971216 RepID=UPI002D4C01E9|nr:DUF1573 domain-containing protein [Oligoflexus sp.]HYX40014.1 DUF1573 domain-containing protein [Oligoflexus sp.]